MRKNNVLLAAAIATTLVMSMNASYAVRLANYPGCTPWINSPITWTIPPNIPCNTPYTNSTAIGSSVVPIPLPDQGIIYGTHLFGSNSDSLVLPSGTNYADARWVIEGAPSGQIQLIATLQGASFNIPPLLKFEEDDFVVPIPDPTVGVTPDCTPAINPTQCTWRFGNAATSLQNNDAFHIVYQLTKAATTLGTNGGTVKMTVKVGTVTAPNIMGEQTITVATGQDPFTVQFKGTDNTYIKVTVAEENKLFVTQVPTNFLPDPEFLDASEVIFGYMYIQPNNYVKIDDGFTDWAFNISNNPITKAGYDQINAVLTTLTLSDNGQFAASTGNNGGVFLHAHGQEIIAKSIKDTDAVWQLTDANLAAMVTGTTDASGFGKCKNGEHCIAFVVRADGTTPINIPPEDGPKVQFNLDYASLKKGLKYPADTDPAVLLTRYRQDGTFCWVYNVPPANVMDQLNLRITNDSARDCSVKFHLYDNTGKPKQCLLVSEECCNFLLKKYATLSISSQDLGKCFGTWTGRATAHITSDCLKMEMLTMLRHPNPRCRECVSGSTLTNLSTGAHGVACSN